MLPLLYNQAERIYGDDDAIGYELNGHKALFLGDHKIVYNRAPIGDSEWHLYNIVKDPGETADLRDEQPERFARMQNLYDEFAKTHGVLPVPADFNPQQAMLTRMLQGRIGNYLIAVVLGLLVLIGLTVVLWRRRRPRLL